MVADQEAVAGPFQDTAINHHKDLEVCRRLAMELLLLAMELPFQAMEPLRQATEHHPQERMDLWAWVDHLLVVTHVSSPMVHHHQAPTELLLMAMEVHHLAMERHLMGTVDQRLVEGQDHAEGQHHAEAQHRVVLERRCQEVGHHRCLRGGSNTLIQPVASRTFAIVPRGRRVGHRLLHQQQQQLRQQQHRHVVAVLRLCQQGGSKPPILPVASLITSIDLQMRLSGSARRSRLDDKMT